MPPLQIAKIAALAHVALVGAGVYLVTQVWNPTPVELMPSRDSLVFSLTALPPLLALWIGSWIARGPKAPRLLAWGLVVALLAYTIAFLMVLGAADAEPLAPLLLVLASLWIALGLLVVVIGVWLTSLPARGGKDRVT